MAIAPQTAPVPQTFQYACPQVDEVKVCGSTA